MSRGSVYYPAPPGQRGRPGVDAPHRHADAPHGHRIAGASAGHQQARAGPQDLPLPAAQTGHHAGQPGLGIGHDLHRRPCKIQIRPPRRPLQAPPLTPTCLCSLSQRPAGMPHNPVARRSPLIFRGKLFKQAGPLLIRHLRFLLPSLQCRVTANCKPAAPSTASKVLMVGLPLGDKAR